MYYNDEIIESISIGAIDPATSGALATYFMSSSFATTMKFLYVAGSFLKSSCIVFHVNFSPMISPLLPTILNPALLPFNLPFSFKNNVRDLRLSTVP